MEEPNETGDTLGPRNTSDEPEEGRPDENVEEGAPDGPEGEGVISIVLDKPPAAMDKPVEEPLGTDSPARQPSPPAGDDADNGRHSSLIGTKALLQLVGDLPKLRPEDAVVAAPSARKSILQVEEMPKLRNLPRMDSSTARVWKAAFRLQEEAKFDDFLTQLMDYTKAESDDDDASTVASISIHEPGAALLRSSTEPPQASIPGAGKKSRQHVLRARALGKALNQKVNPTNPVLLAPVPEQGDLLSNNNGGFSAQTVLAALEEGRPDMQYVRRRRGSGGSTQQLLLGTLRMPSRCMSEPDMTDYQHDVLAVDAPEHSSADADPDAHDSDSESDHSDLNSTMASVSLGPAIHIAQPHVKAKLERIKLDTDSLKRGFKALLEAEKKQRASSVSDDHTGAAAAATANHEASGAEAVAAAARAAEPVAAAAPTGLAARKGGRLRVITTHQPSTTDAPEMVESPEVPPDLSTVPAPASLFSGVSHDVLMRKVEHNAKGPSSVAGWSMASNADSHTTGQGIISPMAARVKGRPMKIQVSKDRMLEDHTPNSDDDAARSNALPLTRENLEAMLKAHSVPEEDEKQAAQEALIEHVESREKVGDLPPPGLFQGAPQERRMSVGWSVADASDITAPASVPDEQLPDPGSPPRIINRIVLTLRKDVGTYSDPGELAVSVSESDPVSTVEDDGAVESMALTRENLEAFIEPGVLRGQITPELTSAHGMAEMQARKHSIGDASATDGVLQVQSYQDFLRQKQEQLTALEAVPDPLPTPRGQTPRHAHDYDGALLQAHQTERALNAEAIVANMAAAMEADRRSSAGSYVMVPSAQQVEQEVHSAVPEVTLSIPLNAEAPSTSVDGGYSQPNVQSASSVVDPSSDVVALPVSNDNIVVVDAGSDQPAASMVVVAEAPVVAVAYDAVADVSVVAAVPPMPTVIVVEASEAQETDASPYRRLSDEGGAPVAPVAQDKPQVEPPKEQEGTKAVSNPLENMATDATTSLPSEQKKEPPPSWGWLCFGFRCGSRSKA